MATFAAALLGLFPPLGGSTELRPPDARVPGFGAAIALAAGPADTPSAQARTSVADIEDEVMCPICGTLLELAESPQAQRQRALIRTLIGEGRNKDEVKDALVAEYGREVLAVPEGSGFDLSAYLIPAIAFAIAALALGIAVTRWRKATRKSPPQGPPGSGPQGEDAARLEADLARYDL